MDRQCDDRFADCLDTELKSDSLAVMSEAELQALVKSIEELRESQRESLRETERMMRESKAETDQATRDLSGVFSTQWGRLVEALVEPSCLDAFIDRGINIRRSFQRAEGIDSDGRQMEIDVLPTELRS